MEGRRREPHGKKGSRRQGGLTRRNGEQSEERGLENGG